MTRLVQAQERLHALQIQIEQSQRSKLTPSVLGCCTGSADWYCSSCEPLILAFVVTDRIYMCHGLAGGGALGPVQLGFVLFHELMHIVSNTVTDGRGAVVYYSIESVQLLATTQPSVSRQTAQAYMLYAMNEGLDNDIHFQKEARMWSSRTENDLDEESGPSPCSSSPDIKDRNSC